jgi:hypothetical protein
MTYKHGDPVWVACVIDGKIVSWHPDWVELRNDVLWLRWNGFTPDERYIRPRDPSLNDADEPEV